MNNKGNNGWRPGMHTNFTMIPNTVDDLGLSVGAYRLYGHYKRVCGDGYRTCYQSQETLGKICRMSPNTLTRYRRELEEANLIEVTVKRDQYGHKGIEVRINDIWQYNHEQYSQQSNYGEQAEFDETYTEY